MPDRPRRFVLLLSALLLCAACATAPEAKPTPTVGPTATPAPTTLQLRGVLEQSSTGCVSRNTNPPPSAPAKVFTVTTHKCVSLGPAEIEVSRANTQVIEAGEGSALHIGLDPADTKRFSTMTAAYVRKRIAFVAYGKLVIAPLIQNQVKSGRLSLVGQKEFLQQIGDALGAKKATATSN